MERNEKRLKSVGEMLQREQEEENVGVMVVSLGQEVEDQEELKISNIEDEEEQGCNPLMLACHKGMTEVGYVLYVCVCVRERERERAFMKGDKCS